MNKLKFNFSPDSLVVKINVPVKANVNLWGDADFGWFDLDFVGFSLCGSLEFSPEVLLGFSKGYELPEDLRNIKVVDIPAKSFVLLIGPVPIIIGAKPALYIRPYFFFDASANLGFSYDWKGQFDVGASWDEDKGFDPYKFGYTYGDGFKFIPPQLTAKLKASFGVAIGGEVTLFRVAGPEIYTGPKVVLESSM